MNLHSQCVCTFVMCGILYMCVCVCICFSVRVEQCVCLHVHVVCAERVSAWVD